MEEIAATKVISLYEEKFREDLFIVFNHFNIPVSHPNQNSTPCQQESLGLQMGLSVG
jgi:hypothetical protein